MHKLLGAAMWVVAFHGTACLAREEAETPFDTRANQVNKTTIEWVTTKDVQKECEKESRRRGLGGFGFPVEACSFWTNSRVTGNTCMIITSKVTNMGVLGHESRHCFQGAFH